MTQIKPIRSLTSAHYVKLNNVIDQKHTFASIWKLFFSHYVEYSHLFKGGANP